jgi:hypothetical protein
VYTYSKTLLIESPLIRSSFNPDYKYSLYFYYSLKVDSVDVEPDLEGFAAEDYHKAIVCVCVSTTVC